MAKVIVWLCVFGLVAAFALLALGVAGWGTAQAMREADPATAMARAEAARHEAEMNRIREAQAQEWAAATAEVVHVVKWPFALTLTALMTLLVCALLARGAMRAQDHAELVTVDGIPYSRQLAVAGGTHVLAVDRVRLAGQAQIEAARNPIHVLPDGLRSYAPRYGNQAARVDALPAPPSDAPALPAPVAVPSLAETLRLAAPGQVIIGFKADGSPVTADLDGIGATLITGERGTGKSTAMTVLAVEAAVRLGARLWVIDRHGRMEQSLTARLREMRPAFAYPPAMDTREIETALDMWEAEIEDRLAGRNGQPWLLLIDEANSFALSAATKPIARRIGDLSERLANEGRKMNLGVVAAAQLANTEKLASSFAYTVSTVMAFKGNPAMVYQYLPSDYANMVRGLERGQAVTLHLGGVDVLRLPQAEPRDLQQAAALLPALGGGASDGRSWAVGGTTGCNPPPPPAAETPPPPDNRLQPVEANPVDNSARIRQLYAQGMTKTAICREVYGYKDGATWDAVEAALMESEEDDDE